jgi:hypothetical protein
MNFANAGLDIGVPRVSRQRGAEEIHVGPALKSQRHARSQVRPALPSVCFCNILLRYMSEVLLDQIPNLSDLQRFLDQLAISAPPESGNRRLTWRLSLTVMAGG